MTNRDVLIIGAGAAGATAAFHLAKAGKSVVLLEKNKDNLIKPCGGGIAASVQQWFPFKLLPSVDKVITNVDFTWKLGDLVKAELPGSSPFWIVRRENFDNLLITQAKNVGAEIIRSFQVEDILMKDSLWQVKSSEGRILRAKSVIIANGSNSPWPQLLGLGPKKVRMASTISIRLEGYGNLKRDTAQFEFGLVHHGFTWAFPIKEGIHIGIGTFLGEEIANSNSILELLLPSLGFKPKEGLRQTSHLRIWNGHHNLHGKGIIAIGDSASLCDPFLAEGLRPALMSGYEGAKSINSWLNGEIQDLSSYTATMRKNWGQSMAWGKRIAQVFYRFPEVGYQLGVKRPTAPKRIAEILSGDMGYGEIAQRVIKRLLFKKN